MKQQITFADMPMRIAVSEFKYKSIHYHPGILELLFALEGEMAVTVNQRSLVVREGSFVAINAGRLHTVQSSGVCTAVSLYFDLSAYTALYPHILAGEYYVFRDQLAEENLPRWDKLRNFFIRTMLMHNKNTAPAKAIMQDLSEKMIHMLWRYFQRHKEQPEQMLERYFSIATYLREHYREDISVADVAKHENISETRVAHFWKDASGSSIRKSITRLRLADAEKKLLETAMTISQIATQSGFSDEKYFYQRFKKAFKTTPNEYRIRYLENQEDTIRVFLSRRESEQRVAAYAMTYYTRDLPDMLPLTEAESQKEQILSYLYNSILDDPHMLIRQFAATGQEAGYLQIAPDRALFEREGEYHINWEYIYAQMHIFLEVGFRINVVISYDIMSYAQWQTTIFKIVDELVAIWGKKVVEDQEYLIHFKAIEQYESCMQLADFLREKTPVLNAQAIHML